MASSVRQVIFTFVLLFGFQLIDSFDLFANPITIFELANKELKFVQLLSHSKNAEILEKYLNKNSVQDLNESYGIHDETIPWDERDIVANPLHVYSLFYRIFVNLPKVTDLIDETKDDGITGVTNDFLNDSLIKNVTKEDMIGVAFALIRIQHVYELEPYEMAMGKLGNRQTNARLSSEELYEIVQIIYYGYERTIHDVDIEYALAITWLEGAIRLSHEEDGSEDNLFVEELKSLLVQIQDEHDKHFLLPWSSQNPDSVQPNSEFFVEKFNGNQSLTSRELRQREKEYLKKHKVPPHWKRDFFTICRNERPVWMGPVKISDVKQCFFKDFSNPFLLLQPARIEILNENPILVQIHDVMPHSWVDKLKNDSEKIMGPARIVVETGEQVSLTRTQSNAWLSEDENKYLAKLSNYLDAVTQLSVSMAIYSTYIIESETYQVGVYSSGGIYLPHFDSFFIESAMTNNKGDYIGDRIATLMLYLSDVDGGGTAFTDIGKVAYPRKGSSVFWFNILSDGEYDTSSIHGACPTIYGIKWVSNKWIRSYAQIFKKPCGLSKGIRIKLFNN